MVYQESRRALGTECLITLNTPDFVLAKNTIRSFWKEIENFENRFSRFKEDSELSKVNIHAGEKIKISNEFQNLVLECINWYKITDGLYNPFILPALQSAGYKGSWPNPNIFNKKLDFSNRNIKNINEIELEDNYITIPKDSALDFGGIGKGYLLKKLSNKLKNKFDGFWISLGGDILADGYNENNQAWKIFISDPSNNKNISMISNGGKLIAIATSGSIKRSGEGWNHIINPKTGLSSISEFLSASVVCSNPLQADILASCFLILKTQEVSKFADEFNVDVLLQRNLATKSSRNLLYLGNRSTFRP